MGERSIDIQDIHDALVSLVEAVVTSNEIARVRATAEVYAANNAARARRGSAPAYADDAFDALLAKLGEG